MFACLRTYMIWVSEMYEIDHPCRTCFLPQANAANVHLKMPLALSCSSWRLDASANKEIHCPWKTNSTTLPDFSSACAGIDWTCLEKVVQDFYSPTSILAV